MQLVYYKETSNFGDLLNPLIFNQLLPDFFDDDPREQFLGIGTILGQEQGTKQTEKLIVYSSGYAIGDEFTYGKPPVLDERYEILCVRGPLTAKVLGLDEKLAVADGALLLKYLAIPNVPKVFAYSYMPHHVSEGMYELWEERVEEAGMHFISPAQPLNSIIEQIQQSEVLITEAMHGAIVADVFRVPWVGVKAYDHINTFKWQDWAKSMKLNVRLHPIPSLFNQRKIAEMTDEVFKGGAKPLQMISSSMLKWRQQWIREPLTVHKLKKLKNIKPQLSHNSMLEAKSQQLLDILQTIKKT
jgi:succinoglycan biosynthesis protein ExoV